MPTRLPRPAAALAAPAVALVVTAVAAAAQTINLPPSRTVELPNGLRVVLAEQHSLPLIEAHLRIPAGAAAEPAGREGLATFTAELLTQGTATRSATEIAAAVDQIGATLSATASRDDLRVSMSFMARHREPALGLLADCVIHAAFPGAEVERIRARLLARLKQTAEEPDQLADMALWRAAFGQDPYGRRIAGGRASLKAISAEEIRAYHQSRVVPAGSALALVGDFDAAAMAEEIARLFASWPNAGPGPTPAPPAQTPPAADSQAVLLIHKPELEQAQIRVGYRGVERGHPDEPALVVATSILGGGFTSRLIEAIRVKRSLSYSARSQLVPDRRTGFILVSTFTKAPTTRQTVDVALAEIQRFRSEGTTTPELARTVSFVAGTVARSLQASDDIAQNLSMVAFHGLPADYVARRVERLRAVTVADVRRVAQEHLGPGRMAMVLVADARLVREQVATLGPLHELGVADLLE